jgi:hypothetical protein
MGKSSLAQPSCLTLPVVPAGASGCKFDDAGGRGNAGSDGDKPDRGSEYRQACLPAHPVQTTIETVTQQALDDPRPSLARRSVYVDFDFDSFLIHDSGRPLVDAHAKYLASGFIAPLPWRSCTRRRDERFAEVPDTAIRRSETSWH